MTTTTMWGLSLALNRGDVVLIPAPPDRSGKPKLRPAIVVQSNTLDVKPKNSVVVAIITSTPFRAQSGPSHLFINVRTEEGIATGLLHDSLVRCECLATIDRHDVKRVIGSLSLSLQVYLDLALRTALNL